MKRCAKIVVYTSPEMPVFIPQGMTNTEEILKISSAKGTTELGGKQQFSAILSRPSCTYYGILSPLKVSEHV